MVIKTAIIGIGKMGQIRKQVIDSHPGFELCAVCDIDQNKAQQYPNLQFETDWQKTLQCKPDAVVVCTFNNIIPEIVCTALEQGIHVFCEKPPGRSVSDVQAMIKAEKKAKDKVLKFGFNHRFHYGIMEAKAIVDSGRYGRLLWARGIYGKAGGLSFENSWRCNKDLAGGGILLDQGIHMLDLLSYFLGEFSEVKSMIENCYWKNIPLEDNVFALLRTPQGQIASLHSSATHWNHKFILDLYMEDGYLSVNGILSTTRSYGEESITFARKQFEGESRAMGKPREETIYFDQDDSWQHEIEDFYDCINGNNTPSCGNSADALQVMRLIEKIYEAKL